jgi:hypothetical protein
MDKAAEPDRTGVAVLPDRIAATRSRVQDHQGIWTAQVDQQSVTLVPLRRTPVEVTVT